MEDIRKKNKYEYSNTNNLKELHFHEIPTFPKAILIYLQKLQKKQWSGRLDYIGRRRRTQQLRQEEAA